MATLQKIRSKGPLLVIVIGLALSPSLPEMLGRFSSRTRISVMPVW